MHVRIWKSGFDWRKRTGHYLFPAGWETDLLHTSRDFGTGGFLRPILELAGSVNWNYADRSLYVVELNPKVLDWERRFFEANLHWIPGKHCVYVGITGLTPEERFRAHVRGEHAAWFVQKYALPLLPNVAGVITTAIISGIYVGLLR
jgi:hypothetical protein